LLPLEKQLDGEGILLRQVIWLHELLSFREDLF
jgi:hypothetical protein